MLYCYCSITIVEEINIVDRGDYTSVDRYRCLSSASFSSSIDAMIPLYLIAVCIAAFTYIAYKYMFYRPANFPPGTACTDRNLIYL